MPTNQGVTKNCPCCEHIGRSDNVVKHIKTVHSKAPPIGWLVSNLPNVILKETVRVEGIEETYTTKIYRDCLCTSCGVSFKNPNSNKTCTTMTHICKPKVQRNRDYSIKKEKTEKTEKTEETKPALSKLSQELIMGLPLKLSKFKNLTESQQVKREKLLETLKETIEDYTEDDVVDYDAALKQMFFDVLSDYMIA